MDQSAPQPIASPAPTQARPRRVRRIVRNVLIGIVAVIAAIWLVLYITKGRFLKHPFERIVGSMTHRTVTVGGDFQLYFAPFRIKFYAERFTEDELRALVAFHDSAIGRSIAVKESAIALDQRMEVLALQQAYTSELMGKFCAAFSCSGAAAKP